MNEWEEVNSHLEWDTAVHRQDGVTATECQDQRVPVSISHAQLPEGLTPQAPSHPVQKVKFIMTETETDQQLVHVVFQEREDVLVFLKHTQYNNNN